MELPSGLYAIHGRYFDAWESRNYVEGFVFVQLEGLEVVQVVVEDGLLAFELPLVTAPASAAMLPKLSPAYAPEETPYLPTNRIAIIPSSGAWPMARPGHVTTGQIELAEALIGARLLHEIVTRGAQVLGAVNRDPRFFQSQVEVAGLLGSPPFPLGVLAGATVVMQPSANGLRENPVYLYAEGAATTDGVVRAAAFVDTPPPALTGFGRALNEALEVLAVRVLEGLLRTPPSDQLPTLGRAAPQFDQDTEAISNDPAFGTSILAQAATAEGFYNQQHAIRLTATGGLLEAVLDEQSLQHSELVAEPTAGPVGRLSPVFLLMLPASDDAGNHLDIVDVESGAYRAAITWNGASGGYAPQDVALEAFSQLKRTVASSEATSPTLFVTMPRLFVHPQNLTGTSPEVFARAIQRTVLTRLLREFPNGIQVVPRDTAIGLILETQDFNASELVYEPAAPTVGKLLPADTAVIPTVWWEQRGSEALVSLQAVHVNRGEVVWGVQESLDLMSGGDFLQSLGLMTEDYGDALLYGAAGLVPAPGSPMLAVQVELDGEEMSVHARNLAIISALMAEDPESTEGRALRVHMEPASFWDGDNSAPLLPEIRLEADLRRGLTVSSAPSHGSPLAELIGEYGREAVVPGFTLLVRLMPECWTLQDQSTGVSVVEIAQVSVTSSAWPFGGIGYDRRVTPYLFWSDRLPPDVTEERQPSRDTDFCGELSQERQSRWPQDPVDSQRRIAYLVLQLVDAFSYKDRDLLARLAGER